MPDNGNVNYSLPINGSYTIPEGYHEGSGKVTQSVTTMNAYSATPNTSVVTIPTDKKYINGNFTIPAFSLPPANALKKGYVYKLYGKTVEGQFEGYVPGNADLYYKGQNPAKFTLREAFGFLVIGSIYFETAILRIVGVNSSGSLSNGCHVLCPASTYNLTPWNRITIEVQQPDDFLSSATMYYGSNFSGRDGVLTATKDWNNGTFYFDISSLKVTKYIGFGLKWSSNGHTSYINRIYFS